MVNFSESSGTPAISPSKKPPPSVSLWIKALLSYCLNADICRVDWELQISDGHCNHGVRDTQCVELWITWHWKWWRTRLMIMLLVTGLWGFFAGLGFFSKSKLVKKWFFSDTGRTKGPRVVMLALSAWRPISTRSLLTDRPCRPSASSFRCMLLKLLLSTPWWVRTSCKYY